MPKLFKQETCPAYEASDLDKEFVKKETPTLQKIYFKENSRSGHGNSLGIQGLMCSFTGKKLFPGSWEEDLDSIVSVYERLAKIFHVSDEDRLKAIPIMLSGDALIYCSANVRGCSTYDEPVSFLRQRCKNSEKRARTLKKWQSLRLTEELMNNPNDSKVGVSRKFDARLLSLQKQLDRSCHNDKLLRDYLMTAVEFPPI